MNRDELLSDAIDLAAQAHRGQTEKSGRPYIEHPLRVMASVRGAETKMAAILHDVVEDTGVSLDDLRQAGFSGRVVAAVDALTKRPGEEYEAYLQRVMENPTALDVKIADMMDNSDRSRLPNPTEKDRARWRKYHDALPRLVAAKDALAGGES